MPCTVCHDLSPPTVNQLKPGQRATIWTSLGELTRSALSGGCIHCSLVHEAIATFKFIWDSAEDSRTVELKLARGKPLEIYYRTQPLYLEVFRPEQAELNIGNAESNGGTVGSAR